MNNKTIILLLLLRIIIIIIIIINFCQFELLFLNSFLLFLLTF